MFLKGQNSLNYYGFGCYLYYPQSFSKHFSELFQLFVLPVYFTFVEVLFKLSGQLFSLWPIGI